MEKESALVKKIQNEFVQAQCTTYDTLVMVPEKIYRQSEKEQQKNIRKEHYFPGGYISPYGQVFSSYKAFHTYTE